MAIKGNWKWYITIAAVRQWMTLTGRTGELEDDNQDYTLRGVPARLIDLRITEGDTSHGAYVIAAEIGRKAGRYDNAERWVIALRRWPAKQATYADADNVQHPLADGRLVITQTPDAMAVVASWDGGSWGNIFPSLRSNLDDYNLARWSIDR